MKDAAGCGVAVLQRPSAPSRSVLAAFVASAVCSVTPETSAAWASDVERPSARARLVSASADAVGNFMGLPRLVVVGCGRAVPSCGADALRRGECTALPFGWPGKTPAITTSPKPKRYRGPRGTDR